MGLRQSRVRGGVPTVTSSAAYSTSGSTSGVAQTVSPLWKATAYDNSGDTGSLPCPLSCNFQGARHSKRYIKQTLITSRFPSANNGQQQSQRLTIETGVRGGILLLRLAGDVQQQILALSKGFTVYNTTPCYDGQPPAKNVRYKGTLLYEYAALEPSRANHRVVTLVGRQAGAYTIVPGPRNSHSHSLYDAQHGGGVHMLAEWKFLYQTDAASPSPSPPPHYQLTVHQPGVDLALVLFLMLLQDLMDADAQMKDIRKYALA